MRKTATPKIATLLMILTAGCSATDSNPNELDVVVDLRFPFIDEPMWRPGPFETPHGTMVQFGRNGFYNGCGFVIGHQAEHTLVLTAAHVAEQSDRAGGWSMLWRADACDLALTQWPKVWGRAFELADDPPEQGSELSVWTMYEGEPIRLSGSVVNPDMGWVDVMSDYGMSGGAVVVDGRVWGVMSAMVRRLTQVADVTQEVCSIAEALEVHRPAPPATGSNLYLPTDLDLMMIDALLRANGIGEPNTAVSAAPRSKLLPSLTITPQQAEQELTTFFCPYCEGRTGVVYPNGTPTRHQFRQCANGCGEWHASRGFPIYLRRGNGAYIPFPTWDEAVDAKEPIQ